MTYLCRWPACSAASRYFARGNDALHGHLCREHYYTLSGEDQMRYAEVGPLVERKRAVLTAEQLAEGYLTYHPDEIPNVQKHRYEVIRFLSDGSAWVWLP